MTIPLRCAALGHTGAHGDFWPLPRIPHLCMVLPWMCELVLQVHLEYPPTQRLMSSWKVRIVRTAGLRAGLLGAASGVSPVPGRPGQPLTSPASCLCDPWSKMRAGGAEPGCDRKRKASKRAGEAAAWPDLELGVATADPQEDPPPQRELQATGPRSCPRCSPDPATQGP